MSSDNAIEVQLSPSERNNVCAPYIYTSEHLGKHQVLFHWWTGFIIKMAVKLLQFSISQENV